MRFLATTASALVIGSSTVGVASPAGSGASSARYNGSWAVQMVKDRGSCDDALRYAIVIQDGDIRLRSNPSDGPVMVSGQVNPAGTVQISASRGIARASASGQLQGASGSGTWQLPLLGCAGRWTARRAGNSQTASQ